MRKITQHFIIILIEKPLKSRLKIENNRTFKRDVDINKWKQMCHKVEKMHLL